ncbi:chromosome segregation protein SMC [Corynebacterium ammoniagenes]|uniref:Chromosome partition protein Smc n=1 Tax=Corynebacterium ammoniagenes DSM 20306 TaxID=649754 RepID=A0ABP2IP28_CORAM|nr:chromosome segregation protein SMC [Corynebacterium ammoniagenes]APT82374.1 chromosome segregation protein SMC [Corynebacterium ammoniagenes DSM 20306]AQS73458.1 chromosome segregation protein SMC [Corynebacterium ammoniagenes]EFG82582.1 chromosome segregation protein SMC [Corynebacterium ammoniagenes DSM 20306]
MHLKSLTLKGFKSFASATTLKFEPGICAVVGPNGSGKSNVVDALAWVMGEGSAKTLRGGKMQDVIFAGAGDRKALGRAEVTLTIDNRDGALPIDYAEVSVTRRMFRDGASEYEINGAKARLMDIQELLSDSGIGREMHIIVGQGKLAEILESRPEDRRSYIEEAAGVLKHRRRKDKAQRKLTGMQANLDRLTDLTEELGKQLKPLERQAQAAQRAATVQADLRDARLKLAGDRVVRVRAEFADAQRQAEILEEQVAQATEALESASEQQLELEEELNDVVPQADAAQKLWFDLSTLVERLAATSRIAEERANNAGAVTKYQGQDPDDLEARASQADEEHAELVFAAEEAAEALESIREEVAERREAFTAADKEHAAQLRAIADRREGVVRLISEEEALSRQVEASEQALAHSEDGVNEAVQKLRLARQEASEVEKKLADFDRERAPLDEAHVRALSESQAADLRLEQLRDQQREFERTVYTLRSRIETLTSTIPPTAEIGIDLQPLAQLISTQYDVALAVALGQFAESQVGEVGADLVTALENAQRTTVFDKAGGGKTQWRMEANLPKGTSWLLDHIVAVPEVSHGVTRVLADVVLVDDFATARQVVNEDPRLRAVTPDGVMVGEGWVSAGTGSQSTVEVTTKIKTAEQELETAAQDLTELSGTLEGAKLAAEDAQVTAAGAKAALRDHDAQVSAWKRDHQRLLSQVETSQKEHTKLAERATELDVSLAKLREQLSEARDRLARVDKDEPDTEASTSERDAASTALDAAKTMEMEAQMSLRSAQDKVGHAAGRGDSLRRLAQQEREAKARHDRTMERRRALGELARTVAAHAKPLGERASAAMSRAAQSRDELATKRTVLNNQLNAAKQTVNGARQRLEQLTNKAHSGDIARSQAQVRLDEAESKISEQLGIAIADLLQDYTPGDDFDRAAETKRLKQAEKDLNSLGKVNPLALEEFKALEERYSFLSTQLDDVTQARTDLEGVIEDVDAQILQLFSDAWHDVEAEFPKVFNTLFPGGEGRLILTEPDSLLTSGIEVEARPPGKKVKRLSLLSGGEKSLTALAMLVAIFRARPSPFYVMDEVEAALDDVNLRRLIALFEELRKDSQLIVITHQKPTMDVANVLYGVTMRGDGVTRVISQRMNPAHAMEPASR